MSMAERPAGPTTKAEKLRALKYRVIPKEEAARRTRLSPREHRIPSYVFLLLREKGKERVVRLGRGEFKALTAIHPGKSYQELAEELGCSRSAAGSYVTQLFDKMCGTSVSRPD